MNAGNDIHYIPHKEIDFIKWDHCISSATNGLIYGYSYYLDHMAKQWDALVLNDYEAVMPLTWNRKYGIYYLYQPFLTPQLGVFGNDITKKLLEFFLLAVPLKFRFVEINLNWGNDFETSKFNLKRRANYSLCLNDSYADITSHYSTNLQRNIRKAVTMGCMYKKNIPIESILQLAKSQLPNYTHLQKDDIPRFKALITFLISKKKAFTSGVYYQHELVASCIFFYDQQRIYYILASNNPKSKKIGASHYLIDRCINENAGTDIVFDFVGSDFASIARFYQSFGGSSAYYPSLKWNNLPRLVKWLKK